MSKIQQFEDIEAWQVARELTNKIYAVTKREPFSKDYGLSNQIQRASVSIMSNIAEGYERGGNKEFGNFLCIAIGSSGEVRAQLYVAFDQNYLTQEEFDNLKQTALRLSRMLFAFISAIKESEFKGLRYKT